VKPTRKELLGVLVAAVGVMLLTSVPYLLAARPGFAGPDLHFSGFIWGGDDGNVYLSQMRQYAEGRLFAYDQFTTLPQVPRYLNVLWLALGRAQRLTGLPLVLIYHLARALGGVLLLYLVYLLAAELGLARRGRILAFLLAAFSSGLGWMVYQGISAGLLSRELGARLAPVDLASGWQAMPEALTFLTLLLSPLFIAGVALICLTYLWGLRAARRPGLGAAVVCGLGLLLLGNVHTYDVLTVCPVLGLWFLLQALRGRLRWPAAVGRYALILAIGLPTTIWQTFLLRSDPTWAAKAATPTPSPALSGYALGFGLPLLLALIGTGMVMGRGSRVEGHDNGAENGNDPKPDLLLAVLWIAVGLVAVYLPWFAFQRKLAEGMHIPMCLLAGRVLGERWGRRLTRSSFVLLALGAVVLTVPSNVYFVSDCLGHMRVNNRDLLAYLLPPAYLTSDELAGLQWLGQHTHNRDVVMASSMMGNYVPAAAPCRVVAGHWGETVNFPHALANVVAFYGASQMPPARQGILAANGCTLVIYGPEERLLQQILAGGPSGERDPATDLPELRPVFQQGELTIYAVPLAPG
jgi:hypothetical protein